MAVTTEQLTPVIAKWKGCESAFLVDVPTEMYTLRMFYLVSDTHQPSESCFDPRIYTDAANDLLGYLCDHHGTLTRQGHEWYWYAWGDDINSRFPNSGQPFRDAVCQLAVDVRGEENEDD